MGESKGGGGGGGGSQSSPYENALANIATDMYMGTAGARKSFVDMFGDILGYKRNYDPSSNTFSWEFSKPNYDPTQLPTYQPVFGLQKQNLESQYQQAKQNIMGQVPKGGNLTGALTNLESGRASAMGTMPAQISAGILGPLLDKAYGVAFNTPTQSISGLSTAAGTYGNRQAAEMAQAAANQQSSYGLLGGLGQGIGKAVGSFK